MEAFEIDQLVLDDLKDKLRELDLNGVQRKVLNAMIRLAGTLADGVPTEGTSEPRAFASDFDAAFTPNQARLVVEYATSADGGVYLPTGTQAHPALSAVAAMITR